jgi:biopolymer transport protein ExbB
VFHFAEGEVLPQDATGFANHATQSTATAVANGQIDAAGHYDGKMLSTVPAAPSLKIAAKGSFTFSAWVKAEGSQSATLFRQQDGERSLTIALDNDQPVATLVGDDGKVAATPPKARLAPNEWHHLAVTASDRLVIFIDGIEVSSAAAELPELGGDITIGGLPGADSGFKGLLDEVRLANQVLSTDWLKLAVIAQRRSGEQDTRTGAD